MDIETLQRNAHYGAQELYRTTGKSVGGPTDQCRRYVAAALSGKMPRDASIGHLQLKEEQKVGITRTETLYAEYYPLEEILQRFSDHPGIPILIEGHFMGDMNDLHCAAIMCAGQGQWAIVDPLLANGIDIVSSSDDVVAWAQRTFYLDTAFFYPVEVDE